MYSLPVETRIIIANNLDCVTLIRFTSTCKELIQFYNKDRFPLHFQLLSLAKENFVIPLSFSSSIEDMISSWLKLTFTETEHKLVRETDRIRLSPSQLLECENNVKLIVYDGEEPYVKTESDLRPRKLRYTSYTEGSNIIYIQLNSEDIATEIFLMKEAKQYYYIHFDKNSPYFPVPFEHHKDYEQGRWIIWAYPCRSINHVMAKYFKRKDSEGRMTQGVDSEEKAIELLLEYDWYHKRAFNSLPLV